MVDRKLILASLKCRNHKVEEALAVALQQIKELEREKEEIRQALLFERIYPEDI
jgi:SpoVK/Ycf46/Vps4 family AAA+-type ATPase